MDEEEWQTTDDLDALIEDTCDRRRVELGVDYVEPIPDYALRMQERLCVHPRKRRLFFCACCRRYPAPVPAVAMQAIEVAERIADDQAGRDEQNEAMASVEAAGKAMQRGLAPSDHRFIMRAAGAAVLPFCDGAFSIDSFSYAERPFLDVDDDDGGFGLSAAKALQAVLAAANDPMLKDLFSRYRILTPSSVRAAGLPVEGTRWHAELVAQCNLWRDIFGNPFRPVAFDRSWLTPTVAILAATVYQERQLPSGLFDNARLGVLADALEDAGCHSTELLGHLRSGGDHVRGCWAVDLVLGKD